MVDWIWIWDDGGGGRLGWTCQKIVGLGGVGVGVLLWVWFVGMIGTGDGVSWNMVWIEMDGFLYVVIGRYCFRRCMRRNESGYIKKTL